MSKGREVEVRGEKEGREWILGGGGGGGGVYVLT